NQLAVNRYLLKRNLLKDLLSVLVRQMDISNSYLQEADFNQKSFDAAENAGAYTYFQAFFKSCRIYTAKGPQRPFDVKKMTRLIDKIYGAADAATDERWLKPQELTVPPEVAKDILALHKALVL